MLRSLFSGISGLQAHQTKLDVVGNNIANVNTVGYKSSTTVFEDTLSQVMRNGSAPSADGAGTNPAQVGLGVQVAGITTNFGQGSAQSTGRSKDFMITGDGFFVTKSGNQQLYTRAGSFDTDGAGQLVTPDGSILQGWMSDASGAIDTNSPVQNLSIPQGGTLAPEATSNSSFSGNLSADAPRTAFEVSIPTYDSLGTVHQLSYKYEPVAADPQAWTVTVLDGTTPVPVSGAAGGPTAAAGTATLTFDAATGKMTGTSATAPATFTIKPTGANWPAGGVTVDVSGLAQYGGKTTAAAKTPATGAGSAIGTLESFSLSNDGTITGLYSNGLKKTIGQVAMATFTNPGGLEKAGNSSYRAGDNSGTPQIGLAGTGGRGELTSGALEMSNVDLAQEFTGLIIAQRGFQANSKVITTSDEILQTLVQMKQ